MLNNVLMLGGKEKAPEAYAEYVEEPTTRPTPQTGVFQRESSSSSNMRCFGRSISSNSPFFTPQIKKSQQAQPRKSERTINVIIELSMLDTRKSR